MLQQHWSTVLFAVTLAVAAGLIGTMIRLHREKPLSRRQVGFTVAVAVCGIAAFAALVGD